MRPVPHMLEGHRLDYKTKPIRRLVEGRVCAEANCITVLSTYNGSDRCYAHRTLPPPLPTAAEASSSPTAASAEIREVVDPARSQCEVALTQREGEILALVADGMRNREIALRLCLSTSTVKAHLAVVFRKLGVSNRTQAARAALERFVSRAELRLRDLA